MTAFSFTKRVQADLNHLGFPVGAVDGKPGSRTLGGYEDAITELSARIGVERPPTVPASQAWPLDNHGSLVDYYGPPGDDQLIRISTPYEMRLSWDKSVKVRKISCHKLVAESLSRVLERILAHYNGDLGAMASAGMLDYGGCYNYRKMRGGSSWSRHAWGIAIDLDPERNGLRTPWPEKAKMPSAVIDIFEAEGWLSGARAWGRDAMHFQATR